MDETDKASDLEAKTNAASLKAIRDAAKQQSMLRFTSCQWCGDEKEYNEFRYCSSECRDDHSQYQRFHTGA